MVFMCLSPALGHDSCGVLRSVDKQEMAGAWHPHGNYMATVSLGRGGERSNYEDDVTWIMINRF